MFKIRKKHIYSQYKMIDGEMKRIARTEKWYLFGFHFWTKTENYES